MLFHQFVTCDVTVAVSVRFLQTIVPVAASSPRDSYRVSEPVTEKETETETETKGERGAYVYGGARGCGLKMFTKSLAAS